MPGTFVLPPCEILEEEDTKEVSELREIVYEYDVLFENCWGTTLNYDQRDRLDYLHVYLRDKEKSYWEGTAGDLCAFLQGRLDVDFPMIRHILGMLPISI